MPADGPTSLYRYFGADDELLYIGITSATPTRFTQHAHTAPWHHEVVRTTIAHFATREGAIYAEKLAIRVEAPKYNVNHNRPTRGKNPRKLVRLDGKSRISLGRFATHNLYQIELQEDGSLLLTPMTFVPVVVGE